MSDIVAVTKRCRICGEVKRLAEFYRNRSNADGRTTECKPCSKALANAVHARRRAELGDEEFRRQQREYQRARRAANGGAFESERLGTRVYGEAVKRLIDAHRAEFDALKRLVRDEMERVS